MYGSHWLKKNLLLKEGSDNSLNKICCPSFKSRRHFRHLHQEFLQLLCRTRISAQFTSYRQHRWNLNFEWKCNCLSKTEMSGLKEILMGQTLDPKPCIHRLPKETVSLISCAALLILGPKSDRKGVQKRWVFMPLWNFMSNVAL